MTKEEMQPLVGGVPLGAETQEVDFKRSSPILVACIPCYNEESHIASVVVRTRKHVDRILVCDDGSTDLTGEIARELGAQVIRHPINMGKGVALADLFREAKQMGADVVVTLDGDGQHDPDEIPLLTEPIVRGEWDVTIGARIIGDGMPGRRKVGNRVLNGFTNRASNGKLVDSQSGFRAFSRKALDELTVKEHGIGVESQLIIEALRKDMRVKEFPVGVKYGSDTSTYSAPRHGVYVLGTILRTVAERSPLLYLGVPGIVLMASGLIVALDLFSIYDATRYWSLPLTIVAGGFFGLGLLLVVAALLLYSINNLEVRLRQSR